MVKLWKGFKQASIYPKGFRCATQVAPRFAYSAISHSWGNSKSDCSKHIPHVQNICYMCVSWFHMWFNISNVRCDETHSHLDI